MTKDCFWCDLLHFRYKLANNYTSIVFAGILTWERCSSICDTRMKASEENSGEEWFVFPSLDLVVTLSLAEGRESLGKVTVYVLYIWRPETQRCLHPLSAPLSSFMGLSIGNQRHLQRRRLSYRLSTDKHLMCKYGSQITQRSVSPKTPWCLQHDA